VAERGSARWTDRAEELLPKESPVDRAAHRVIPNARRVRHADGRIDAVFYSDRSDSIGSITAARRAGIQLETSAVSRSTLTAKPSVRASRASTP